MHLLQLVSAADQFAVSIQGSRVVYTALSPNKLQCAWSCSCRNNIVAHWCVFGHQWSCMAQRKKIYQALIHTVLVSEIPSLYLVGL